MLLVKCRKTDYWKFPGGGLEPDERAAKAAIRELEEEVNHTIIALASFDKRTRKELVLGQFITIRMMCRKNMTVIIFKLMDIVNC